MLREKECWAMAVPKFYEFFKPTLLFLNGTDCAKMKEMYPALAKTMRLSEEDMRQMVPSGKIRTYVDRISWSVQYLKNAGLIERLSHGTYRITQEGKKALASNAAIDLAYLEQFDSFKQFKGGSKTDTVKQVAQQMEHKPEQTPKEMIEAAYQAIHAELAKNLLNSIMESTPDFFEKLVVDLLLAMGYGYDNETAGMVTGKTGDGGIDGIINEDKLGFNQVYVQAKRWNADHSVGSPDIHGFIGALVSKGATKGLFITTSHFTQAAKAAAAETKSVKIVLVDGAELAKLMIAHGVGVSVEHNYPVMQIDNDYFEE